MNGVEGEGTFDVLKKAYERLPVSVFIIDPLCELFYANSAALALVGYTKEEFSVKRLQAIAELLSLDSISNIHKNLLANCAHELTVSALINTKDCSKLACKLLINLIQERQHQYIIVTATEERTGDDRLLNANEFLKQKVVERTEALATVFERISDGFMAFDKDWNFTHINRNAAVIINKQPEEVINKNLWEVFPDSAGGALYEKYHKAMREQVVSRSEEYSEILQKWFEGVFYPSQQGLSVFFQDITEKKKAQVALQEKEEMYRTIVETSQEGIWQIDAQNQTTFVNDYLPLLLGYTKEEMTGKSFLDFMTEEAKVEALAMVELRKQGIATQHEFTFLRKDGAAVHTLLQTSPIFKNGNYAGAVAMVLNNTERKEVEEKLVSSERRFRALFEYSQDGIALLSDTGTIINVSPSIEKILGLTKDELLGTNRLDYIHPDDVHIIWETVAGIIREPLKSKTVEYRAHPKNGTQKCLECTYTNLLSEPAIEAIVLNFRDITDRKNAENKLKESEAKYRKAQTQGKLGHWEWDTATNQLVWSDEIYTMLGLDADIASLDYEKFMDCIHSDEKVQTDLKIRHAMANNEGYEIWPRVVLADGSVRNVYILAEPVKNQMGDVVKFVGMVQDVTAQKQIEAELSLSEQNYRLLFEKSPVPFFMVDIPSLSFVEVNKAAIDLYGYSRQEFLSMNARDIRSENNDAFYAQLDDFNRKEEPQQNIVKHKKRNGEIIIVQLVTNYIFYNGKTVRLASARDITQEMLYEKQLLEKERQLSLIFNSSVNGMALLSVEKGGQLRYEAINDALCKWIRMDREKLLGLLMSNVFKPEDVQHVLPGYMKAIATGEVQSFTGNSTQRLSNNFVEVTAIPIKNEPGEVVQLLSVSNDITERKRAENDLVKKNIELRQLSLHLENIREEERTKMSREIHDELGQQLTGLKMEIAWLDRNLQEKDDKTSGKIKSCLELIDETIHSVRRIATALRPSILDDLGLAEALNWQGTEFSNQTGIPLTFYSNLEEIKFPPVLSIAIFRIFQEALTNVARHAEATRVTSSLEVEDSLLLLTVSDNGKGFVLQQDAARKSLGLLGMRERVEILNGNFTLNSQPGEGTIVSIKIPLN
ncbi:MAG TPA: PAS domain S-box protein [Chitinophagaceae bacterium]|nr:PAS domain S-box protein [Chitinophagaceae bacterium]